MWSILGVILILVALAAVALWCLALSDELRTLKARIDRLGYEPTRRAVGLDQERKTRKEQMKAIRTRVRQLEWKFRDMVRPATPSGGDKP